MQTKSHGLQAAAKSPNNNLLGRSFHISRQQQGQSNANNRANPENSRYIHKQKSDMTTDHQNQIKSIEKLAQREIAESLGRHSLQNGIDNNRDNLNNSRTEKQR